MRRTLLVVVFLLIAGLLLWVYTSTTWIIWDGGFDLTVHVSSNSGQPHSVSCQAFGHQEDAEFVLEHLLPPETRLWTATAEPFEEQPLTVNIPVSGRESMSGRQLQRSQFRYLVVIGQWQNGQRVGKLVEIPDGRVSHEVSVVLR